jgi:UDP-N-acetylglucosamine/UDP-N-acetylgalactosamine 4-epimerase
MSAYADLRRHLTQRRYRWCVTGAAGFIGSNLLQTLLELDQEVVGLDNFSTGFRHNLEQVRGCVDERAWSRFRCQEGDVRRAEDCVAACEGVDFILHQAALGSVPRSIADPRATHEANVDGFLNMLIAARDAGAKRFVYASSSSVYGDHPALPKREENVGQPLSPYAATKSMNEMYAAVFARSYGVATIGLRYFNVFGPRQDPHGAYAAVIPRWVAALIGRRPVQIFGDGETSRDFCYVDNAIQMNLLSALTADADAINQVYNVAVGDRTTLNELFRLQRELLSKHFPHIAGQEPVYGEFRAGDVRHSQADIAKAVRNLGYAPTHGIRQGMEQALAWYIANLAGKPISSAA